MFASSNSFIARNRIWPSLVASFAWCVIAIVPLTVYCVAAAANPNDVDCSTAVAGCNCGFRDNACCGSCCQAVCCPKTEQVDEEKDLPDSEVRESRRARDHTAVGTRRFAPDAVQLPSSTDAFAHSEVQVQPTLRSGRMPRPVRWRRVLSMRAYTLRNSAYGPRAGRRDLTTSRSAKPLGKSDASQVAAIAATARSAASDVQSPVRSLPPSARSR